MKKLILIIVAVLSIGNLSAQQQFSLVKEIDINSLDISKMNKITAEFRSNRKFVSKNKAIKISDIVKLCDNCFAEIEDSKGKFTYLSPNDLNTNINGQKALLLVGAKFSGLGDTLVIGEDELGKLEDNKLLDIELGSVTSVSYSLNSKSWNKSNKDKYFKPNSIIFPFDNSTARWITDVRRIRIFRR